MKLPVSYTAGSLFIKAKSVFARRSLRYVCLKLCPSSMWRKVLLTTKWHAPHSASHTSDISSERGDGSRECSLWATVLATSLKVSIFSAMGIMTTGMYSIGNNCAEKTWNPEPVLWKCHETYCKTWKGERSNQCLPMQLCLKRNLSKREFPFSPDHGGTLSLAPEICKSICTARRSAKGGSGPGAEERIVSRDKSMSSRLTTIWVPTDWISWITF